MRIWTVIGLFDDTGQAFAEHVVATDEYRAMATVGKNHAHTDLVIVGAIAGGHDLHTPGDDNGTIAAAADMADLA